MEKDATGSPRAEEHRYKPNLASRLPNPEAGQDFVSVWQRPFLTRQAAWAQGGYGANVMFAGIGRRLAERQRSRALERIRDHLAYHGFQVHDVPDAAVEAA
jgi:hypothetical protein